MAKIYFNRLCLGTITYDAIPARYQPDVKEYGREKVREGLMPITQYEMLYKEPYEAED